MCEMSASAGVQHIRVCGADEGAPLLRPDASAVFHEVPISADSGVIRVASNWTEVKINHLKR